MSAILFGSISTLADTSELQRRAFNEAFATHGLGWTWSQDDYRSMLGSNGGAQRIADYASANGEQVAADDVHATKSAIFQELLTKQTVTPRPGVTETILSAKENGIKVALVTTTSPENVAALLAALTDHVGTDSFDVVVDKTMVDTPKPNPAAYAYALRQLGEEPGGAVAIEDNVGGVRAAVDAGVTCIAFPNENTAAGDFGAAAETVDKLEAARLTELARS